MDSDSLSFFVRCATFILTVMASRASGETINPLTQSLPEAISSFGAATCDGWIYVYGGHIGTAHDHSRDNLSKSFRKRSVAGGVWEELPMQTPLQGLAMVAYDDSVYRIGGMTARNASDAEADLQSIDTFARFDPATNTWTDLAPLPEGRSSHDAVVMGSTVYVVGGWKLNGAGDGNWHTRTLAFDFQRPEDGWTEVEQPFERRAVAASHFHGKLYVIGGMNAAHEIDRTVDVYDPATRSWSKGPELPGEGLNGFGAAAWSDGRDILVSGSNGVVYRLSVDMSAWEDAGRLTIPRFFHRLVPAEHGVLLAIGGASMHDGHLSDIERLAVEY